MNYIYGCMRTKRSLKWLCSKRSAAFLRFQGEPLLNLSDNSTGILSHLDFQLMNLDILVSLLPSFVLT